MTTFIEGVNRVLRQTGLLSQDDSDVATFSDTQHKANVQLAIIAIQSTLNEVVSDKIIPNEVVDGTITQVSGTRTYALPTDFIRFADNKAFLLKLDSSDNSDNRVIYEYPGGRTKLSQQILDYREQPGDPINFYYEPGTAETIGLYQVPDSTVDTLKLRFSYEKEVMVTTEANNLPFSRTSMDYAFIDMASRRLEILKSGQSVDMNTDGTYKSSKAVLISLINFKHGNKKYGHSYR